MHPSFCHMQAPTRAPSTQPTMVSGRHLKLGVHFLKLPRQSELQTNLVERFIDATGPDHVAIGRTHKDTHVVAHAETHGGEIPFNDVVIDDSSSPCRPPPHQSPTRSPSRRPTSSPTALPTQVRMDGYGGYT
jgi:hypothetical protein